MPLQEGARAVDGARLQLRRILPGEHRDLGIRAERDPQSCLRQVRSTWRTVGWQTLTI